MSVSMKPMSLMNAEEIKSMNFLGLQISNIFNRSTDKTVQITELAKELLGSKKETPQETEVALLASKYRSFIGEQPLKVFAMSLHKLPSDPLEVGLEYIQKAPGYDPVKGFQVPKNWRKTETVTLNQIYKEQFFAWIVKNSQLPFDSILNTLHLLKGFDDLSIQLDDKMWNKFLLAEKEQKQLKEFQSKYEFLIRNKFLQSFPIELENIKVTRDIQKSIDHQNEIISKIFKWLFSQLLEEAQVSNDVQAANTCQMLINSLEDLPERNFSKKVLAYKLRKILPFLQEKFFSLIEYSNQHFQTTKEKQTQLKELQAGQIEVEKVLKICREKDKQISSQKKQSAKDGKKANLCEEEFNIQNIGKALLKQHQELTKQGVDSVARDALFNQQLHKILEEKMTTLEHVRSTEAYFGKQNECFEKRKKVIQSEFVAYKLSLLKEDFSRIHFLISHMNTDIAKEQARWKEERLNLSIHRFDEMLEKEFAAECKISSFKTPKRLQKSLNLSDEESISSEEEEESAALLELLASSPTHASKQLYTDEQIRSYLNNKAKNKQLNGALSQSVESILQQIQPYLHRKQGKEVYDHALLGAAALEQMAQAIHEGRIDHIALGFRSSLIHCHFAVEQILKQEIFQKTGKVEDSHNLTALANMLEANTQKPFSEKDREFLEEVRVHLWFHYPEDYRLYFTHNKTTPKAFSLLEALSQPGITKEHVQEAMEFAFEKYCQTLEFMTKLSQAPAQNAVELFKSNTTELQKHLNAISKKPKKLPVNTSSLIPKINRVLKKLTFLGQLIHMKDFEDGWLLAIFDSIKSYLQLMKGSLETPQKSTTHSLQKFMQVETLFNMDRLFKNLFRAVSFLHLGEDNRMHSLNRFYSVIHEFYKEVPLSEEDRSLLKSINLGITHHYLHDKSHADLKSIYSHFLDKARALSSVDEGFSHITTKNGNISAMDLQKELEEDGQMMQTMHKSLDLLIKLLQPVIDEMQKINSDIEKELKQIR